MTRTQTLNLLNGFYNGRRKLSDLFAEWPTKTYIRYLAYPNHYENTLGIPVPPHYVQQKQRTYPKVYIRVVADSVDEVQRKLQRHVAEGRDIYVPMIVDDDEEVQEVVEEIEEDQDWAIKTTSTTNEPDEYIDADGTRMVKLDKPKHWGNDTYQGFSKKYLEKHPNAYQEVIENPYKNDVLLPQSPEIIRALSMGGIGDDNLKQKINGERNSNEERHFGKPEPSVNLTEPAPPPPKYCIVTVKNSASMSHKDLGEMMRKSLKY